VKEIGFIGLGNMACAIINGLLISGSFSADKLCGYDVSETARLKANAKFGLHICESNIDVFSKSNIIILAVKPQVLPTLLDEWQGKFDLCPDKLLLSNVTGADISTLVNKLGMKKVVRCMPNTPALVGCGATAFACSAGVTAEDREKTQKILNSFGQTYEISEHLMPAITGVSGSSPAYVYLFIESLAGAGVAQGLTWDLSYRLAAQAVMGSAKMVLETGLHPGVLKDMVCSPGGTTIAAIKVLEEKGFRAAVMDAVEVCVDKAKRM